MLIGIQRDHSNSGQVIFNEFVVIKPGKIQLSPCCAARDLNVADKAPALKLKLELPAQPVHECEVFQGFCLLPL